MNGLGIIGGYKMRYCGLIEDREQKKFTESKIYFFGIWMLVFGISAAGCVSEPTRTYGKDVVTVNGLPSIIIQSNP